MAGTALSVVIPTHKRADILKQCLDHLDKQTIRDDIEVIVVSDGHDEETANLFQYYQWDVAVVTAEIPKSQQGEARNKGVELASGKYVMYIGDDIFLSPTCCEKHVEAHKKMEKPCAVLGYTTWDSNVEITPVMRWLESSGWQFGYPMIGQYEHKFLPVEIQHKFSYTSNISVPREVARAHKFMPGLKLYGWEDIEWGHRKKKAGIRVYYEPDAQALHHHHITLEDSLKRMEILGKSARHIHDLHPELDLRPTGLKLLAYHLTALFPTMTGQHRKAFLKGLAEK